MELEKSKMRGASNPALSGAEGFGKRLRQLAVAVLFALVLLIPKILHLRRNPRSWMLFRIFLGVAGAALVVLPVGLGTSFVPAIIGLAMFISAILLPPAKPDTSADDKPPDLPPPLALNPRRSPSASPPS